MAERPSSIDHPIRFHLTYNACGSRRPNGLNWGEQLVPRFCLTRLLPCAELTTTPPRRGEITRLAAAPVAQLAEANPLKGFKCGFESHRGHRSRPAYSVFWKGQNTISG